MDCIELIKKCLVTGGDKMEGYDSKDRDPNICLRMGAQYIVVPKYELNLDSVIVLAQHEYKSDKSEWDGDFQSYCIFKFDKGYGVAYNTGWWGPTFGENQYDIDIQEEFNFSKFIDFVLTDELREKLKDSADNLDVDLAEMVLLNKDCD